MQMLFSVPQGKLTWKYSLKLCRKTPVEHTGSTSMSWGRTNINAPFSTQRKPMKMLYSVPQGKPV